jgi:fumarate reductase subunit C
VNQEKSTRYPVYKQPMSATWWLSTRNYFLFMLREVSALFVASFVVSYLVGLYRLSQGEAQYTAYLESLQTPFACISFVLILAFALYHTVTWFSLTPIVMVVRVGSRVIPARLVLLTNYLAWLVLSGLLFYLLGTH